MQLRECMGGGGMKFNLYEGGRGAFLLGNVWRVPPYAVHMCK